LRFTTLTSECGFGHHAGLKMQEETYVTM